MFETTILGGLPVTINIVSFYKGSRATYWEPEEYPEVEFEICWRKGGVVSDKVMAKITDKEMEGLEQEAFDYIRQEARDAEDDWASQARDDRMYSEMGY